tara:strand:- start:109 stop:696 length:588 start_codon:yes stop_codon:yes gene_type:complete
MKTKQNILEIYHSEINFLKDGIKNSKNPYHTFTLSTLEKEFPKARTVVLRNVETDPIKIFFNADYRSPKIKQLIDNPQCSALFYDINRRVQIRMNCSSTINYRNHISAKIWVKTALQSRKCYMGPYTPSSTLDTYHPNIPLEYAKKDPDKANSEEGYVNFVHVELSIIDLDILQLHHDGHIRFLVSGDKFSFLSP